MVVKHRAETVTVTSFLAAWPSARTHCQKVPIPRKSLNGDNLSLPQCERSSLILSLSLASLITRGNQPVEYNWLLALPSLFHKIIIAIRLMDYISSSPIFDGN